MKPYETLNKEDKNRSIVFPDQDEELAEFMGILTGDGFINQYPERQAYLIEIAGNKLKDFNYLREFVSNLVKNLFNLTPKFYSRKDQNTIYLYIRSKGIFYFLKENGFPPGKKREIAAPKWIIKNPSFFGRFVCGVFDTDGYLCLKNKEGKKYPVLGLSSNSKTLLKQIQKFLKEYEITSYLDTRTVDSPRYKRILSYSKLQISGKRNITQFFDKIGSNNSRNITKYEEMNKLYGLGGNRTHNT